jgi:hypothetical protein
MKAALSRPRSLLVSGSPTRSAPSRTAAWRPSAGLAHHPWTSAWNVLRGPRTFTGGLGLFQGGLDRIAGGDVLVEGQDATPYKPLDVAAYVTGDAAAACVTVVA